MSAATLAAPSVPCSHPPGSEGRIEAREAERRLLIRYHADGDLRARDELVERLMPLARDLALRYSYTREPLDDLTQHEIGKRVGCSQMHVSRLMQRALRRLDLAAAAT